MSGLTMTLLTFQILLGALDNILHHEITERLPSRPSARKELSLHAAREAIYAVIFLVLAWTEPAGAFSVAVLALLLCEVTITIADFLEEDCTRHLPTLERVLHTILAILYGGFLISIVPWLYNRISLPSALETVSHGLLSWFFTLSSIGVFAFAIRNAIAVRALAKREPVATQVPSSGRTVLITGATGFIGSPLVARFTIRGDRVVILCRDKRQAKTLFGSQVIYIESLEDLPNELQIDGVINLAGAPIIGLPWSPKRRKEILRSRVKLTNHLVEWMKRLHHPPRVLINGSAIGIYGDQDDDVLTEASEAGSGFAAELCKEWERAALRACALNVRVVCLRIGLVLDRSGGALPMMVLPVRLAFGSVLGTGQQWMSWITRDDLLRLIVTAFDSDKWQGAINAVAPEPSKHLVFQRALARTLRRPLYFHVPSWLLKRAIGEMSSIFLYSQRVIPAEALRLGFAFDIHWAADALNLALAPSPSEPAPKKQRLQFALPMEETEPTVLSPSGAHDDNHHLRRTPFTVRSQSARGTRGKAA